MCALAWSNFEDSTNWSVVSMRWQSDSVDFVAYIFVVQREGVGPTGSCWGWPQNALGTLCFFLNKNIFKTVITKYRKINNTMSVLASKNRLKKNGILLFISILITLVGFRYLWSLDAKYATYVWYASIIGVLPTLFLLILILIAFFKLRQSITFFSKIIFLTYCLFCIVFLFIHIFASYYAYITSWSW